MDTRSQAPLSSPSEFEDASGGENQTLPALADPERLAALDLVDLLDTPADESFDRFTRLVRLFLRVPVALISLVDDHRQFFKSCQGLPERWARLQETPLTHSFCKHVVSNNKPLIIDDVRLHDSIRTHKAVTELNVISYLGYPLTTPGGLPLGSLCAIDTRPRCWTWEELNGLEVLAELTASEIEARILAKRYGESYQSLWEAEAQRDELFHFLIHDLSTPLTSLLTGLDRLQRADLVGPEKRTLNNASLAGQAIKEMVGALLELEHARAQPMQLRREPVPALDLVEEAFQEVANLAEARNIALKQAIPRQLPALRADRLHLRRVLVNLLGNALEHSPVGGRIKVSAAQSAPSELTLWVEDDGRGIPPENREHVFDRFGQVKADCKRIRCRSGLGLPFCKLAVEAHGGQIGVDSKEDQGARFYLKLPLHSPAARP